MLASALLLLWDQKDIYIVNNSGGGSSLASPILLGFCDPSKVHVHLALLSLSDLQYSKDSNHTHLLKDIHFRLLGLRR